jgi:hypothetical protein
VDRAEIAYERLSAFVLDDSVTAWPYGQVLEAAIAMGDAAGIDRLVAGLARYWDGAAYRAGVHGGDRYYDDNAWLALAQARVGRMDDAARVFRWITNGWDARRGGVYWTDMRGNTDRNTVSTAPNGQLAMQLFAKTQFAEYREWAQRMHDWVDATLRDPADGLYWDHIDQRGTIEKTTWSYNQGCMAGLKAALGLDGEARSILASTLPRIHGQPLAFNAIFFRNALTLGVGSDELRTYAASLATEHGDLLSQAAAVQLLVMAR